MIKIGIAAALQDRLDLRRMARENSAWVRQVVLAEAA